MNYNELIERYVYAVTRQLPAKQRADIEKELRSIINDMLEERCGDVTPTERDVNVVLAELGKPSELAAKYDPNGERSLIGPRYFRRYVQTMKMTLPCVVIGLVIAAVISTFVEGIRPEANLNINGVDLSWLAHILSWIGNIVSSVFCAAAIVTMIFAFFEYKGIALDEDDIAKLPKVPEKNQRIKKGECIASIVLSVIFGAVFMLAPQVISAVTIGSEGVVTSITVFDTEVIRGMWPVWLALIVLGIGRDCFGIIEGVYSVRYAIVSAVVGLLSAVGVVFGFTRDGIMNPEFVGAIGNLFKFEQDAEFLTGIFANFNLFLIGVWLFALVLDVVSAVAKAFKYRKSENE